MDGQGKTDAYKICEWHQVFAIHGSLFSPIIGKLWVSNDCVKNQDFFNHSQTGALVKKGSAKVLCRTTSTYCMVHVEPDLVPTQNFMTDLFHEPYCNSLASKWPQAYGPEWIKHPPLMQEIAVSISDDVSS